MEPRTPLQRWLPELFANFCSRRAQPDFIVQSNRLESCRKFRTGIRGDGGRGNAGSNTIDYVIITTAMRQQPYLLLAPGTADRSEEHTSELQSHVKLVCRLLLEKK